MKGYTSTSQLTLLYSFRSMLVRVPSFVRHALLLNFLLRYLGPRLCLGQQYAYNQMSFMLIRLLQTFESVTLAKEAQPAGSLPPAEWKQSAAQGKRKAREEFWPKTHLTMYANVCHHCPLLSACWY